MTDINLTAIPSTIQFYWTKSELFTLVQLQTIYRAKNIKSKDGESLIDDYAMTTDEEDAFIMFAKEALNDLFESLFKLTSGITDTPITYNDTITLADGTTTVANAYAFKIVNNKSYNNNNLIAADAGFKDFLKSKILYSWYEMAGHENEAAIWLNDANNIKATIISTLLFQFRKPIVG